ncbi:hypothetical protein GCK72_006274 [Caenorhabditis remanei]|uniref:Uncharacterized protein n=1 Tax=Caenorhabditis remanei TaxID=31234 RepID=A0A6A5HEU6_CAERE|nr:hypothetical protein GCK72_006274 [Caenorhabditis remanei]KAF1766318.1 hypothetical protein GCK72_006274 [Caenorhabditis remanei]
MSISSHHLSSLAYDEDCIHSVIDEKTPSPPPKPPRGILRKGAPMKPQRSALKIDPLQNDDKENCNQPQPQSQFKAKERMEQMQDYFKRSIAVIRRSEEFTGVEAADILTAYIESHRDDFPENVGRSNAVKLLGIWLESKTIQSVDIHQKKFLDSERAFYRLGGESENLYIVTTPVPSRDQDEHSTSVSRASSTRRSNSFKRLFSPLIPVRRNRSTSRGRDKDNGKEGGSTLLKSTWSLFSSSDKQEKKARKAEQQMIKEEEAEVYELALFHLLSLIEVEFLEDVALPVQDVKKNASFLSSILEKVGLGAGEDRLDPQQEEEMDLVIETHPLIRDARSWFQMARCCAPLLYLENAPGKTSKMQMFLWCRAALTAVKARLEKITRHGESPLFPAEFSPLLNKIAQQHIMDTGEKLPTAIMYIFLMVPNPLRKTIDQIVHWLELTMRADAVEDLRSPFYLGQMDPRRYRENFLVIVEELCPFIFPKGCMTNGQEIIFMETLVELRRNKRLGLRPQPLENSLRAKHNSTENELTPVRFTVPRESVRSKSLKSTELSETDSFLVQMINNMLDDKKTTLSDKRKRLAEFEKCYPILYKNHFNGML